MRYALPAFAMIAAVAALTGCEPPTSTSSTTVVKEQPIVQKETKETIVQAPAPSTSTTIIQPAPSAPAEPAKPESTETTQTTTRSRDTPYGQATRTDSTTTKTTQ